MKNIVYVVERNGVPKTNAGGVSVEVLPSPRHVDAWEHVRPLSEIRLDTAVPYVSVETVEKAALEGGVEAILKLVRSAKSSLPELSGTEIAHRAQQRQRETKV